MLAELGVKNFVLLEELSLSLEPGFNVLTGETGAGKSIVIGALGLVLGGRAAPDLVRPGAEEAEVEALFDHRQAPPSPRALRAKPARHGKESSCGGWCRVRAVRAYLNGRLCTASQLAELASELVDISSQHQSVALTDPATHLVYLDAFAKLDAIAESTAR